jgi:hypothetical protein
MNSICKILIICYGHLPNFKLYPGSVLLVMGLESCNASVSYDIDGSTESFYTLTLNNYPGENIAEFATEAFRLIKIMQGGYTLPINTGSQILVKVLKTLWEELNRKFCLVIIGEKIRIQIQGF